MSGVKENEKIVTLSLPDGSAKFSVCLYGATVIKYEVNGRNILWLSG